MVAAIKGYGCFFFLFFFDKFISKSQQLRFYLHYIWFQHRVCVSSPGHEQVRFCRPRQISQLRPFPRQDAESPRAKALERVKTVCDNSSQRPRGGQSREERKQSSAGRADDSGPAGENVRNAPTCRHFHLVSLLCLSLQVSVGFLLAGLQTATNDGGPEHSQLLTPPTPRVASLWSSHVLTSNKQHNQPSQLLSSYFFTKTSCESLCSLRRVPRVRTCW